MAPGSKLDGPGGDQDDKRHQPESRPSFTECDTLQWKRPLRANLRGDPANHGFRRGNLATGDAPSYPPISGETPGRPCLLKAMPMSSPRLIRKVGTPISTSRLTTRSAL